jgi:hypothetical protein
MDRNRRQVYVILNGRIEGLKSTKNPIVENDRVRLGYSYEKPNLYV